MADNNNTTLSLCVDKVLDHVGASEQIRRNHVEKAMVDEAVDNLTFPLKHVITKGKGRWHNFGSWCEGTTTKGLNSDIDKLCYRTDFPAVEEIPDGFENGFLIINDGTTKPGYVKLQLVLNEFPFVDIVTSNMERDQFGRVCINNLPFKNEFKRSIRGVRAERNGPAFTMSDSGHPDLPEVDNVWAYRCYSIPSFTSEWIDRPRKNDWPSKQLLDKMSTYGCFLVRKGHPSSQTEHLEWRISFSFQERELMFSINSTQHKCYILLKMINQYLVSKMNVKSISSYHLKTSLFYTIENNPTHIWIPDNLVYCTELCLKQLLDWLNNENCPNFFVPEENMFDRLSSDVMKMAAKFIRDMLDSDGQYLMLLTCDKFGELLQDTLFGKVLPDLSLDAIKFYLDSRLKVYVNSLIWENRSMPLTNCASENLNALKLLLEQLRKSEETLTSEKVFREIEKALYLILSHIHLQIAQTIAAIMLTVTDADKKRELAEDFNHHFEQAKSCDTMSQSLIKASLLFKENKLEECERILADCETSLNATHSDYLLNKVNPTSLSLIELGKHVTPCLIFPPSQADLVPTPLQYEMYRSVGADTSIVHPEYDYWCGDTLDPDLHYWYGAIGVDTKVYLHFLQYLVFSKLKKHDLAVGAKIKIFVLLFKASKVIQHLETGFNLLGWICKYENEIELAALCFYMSWQVRPDHNAAKWHMLVMMYEQYIRGLFDKFAELFCYSRLRWNIKIKYVS